MDPCRQCGVGGKVIIGSGAADRRGKYHPARWPGCRRDFVLDRLRVGGATAACGVDAARRRGRHGCERRGGVRDLGLRGDGGRRRYSRRRQRGGSRSCRSRKENRRPGAADTEARSSPSFQHFASRFCFLLPASAFPSFQSFLFLLQFSSIRAVREGSMPSAEPSGAASGTRGPTSHCLRHRLDAHFHDHRPLAKGVVP